MSGGRIKRLARAEARRARAALKPQRDPIAERDRWRRTINRYVPIENRNGVIEDHTMLDEDGNPTYYMPGEEIQ